MDLTACAGEGEPIPGFRNGCRWEESFPFGAVEKEVSRGGEMLPDLCSEFKGEFCEGPETRFGRYGGLAACG